MNILFLTISRIPSLNASSIYMDLMREFEHHGHNVYIITSEERKYHKHTFLEEENKMHLMHVKILNLQKTNILEKGLSTLTVEKLYRHAIKKYIGGVKFDLIMYSTPPITFSGLVNILKKRDDAKTYLLLKDIFPQNAVDLGMFGKRSFFYKYFRSKESELYRISDFIGCMSPANVKFVLDHNTEVDASKVEVCQNSIKLRRELVKEEMSEVEAQSLNHSIALSREYIRAKYGVPTDKTVFIYGGNLGKPQGVDFLPVVVESNEKRNNAFFLIVGKGSEYPKLRSWFDEHQPKNSKLLAGLPSDEYNRLVQSCDVGMIFLNSKFTIPNYPSRLLSYLQNKKPVICAVDRNTDIGTIAVENGYGLCCENGNLAAFNFIVDEINKPSEIKEMGEKGYDFLCKNYIVERSYGIIMTHFE